MRRAADGVFARNGCFNLQRFNLLLSLRVCQEAFDVMTASNIFGETILSKAVDTHNIELFLAVGSCLRDQAKIVYKSEVSGGQL